MTSCTVCGERAVARRLCRPHYNRALAEGTLAEHATAKRSAATFVCPPEHSHANAGTCYKTHGCRCDPCRDARAAERRITTRAKAYGTYDTGLVDAAPVRAHLRALMQSGAGYRQVARALGAHERSIADILYEHSGRPPALRVQRRLAERILRITTEHVLSPRAHVPSRGLQRRLQALQARGWSLLAIGAHVGLDGKHLSRLMRSEGVTKQMHDRVAAAYDEIWDVAPPQSTTAERASVTRTLATAQRNGWAVPMDWDDIDTDEKPADPYGDGAVEGANLDTVQALLAGEQVPHTMLDRAEAVRRLVVDGLDRTQISERMGLSLSSVKRAKAELAA